MFSENRNYCLKKHVQLFCISKVIVLRYESYPFVS